jgi:hypothetical protein
MYVYNLMWPFIRNIYVIIRPLAPLAKVSQTPGGEGVLTLGNVSLKINIK